MSHQQRKAAIRNVILKLYREDKDIVNNDVILLEQVWLTLGWREDRSLYDNMVRLPRPESITRARRQLHWDGLIEYSEEADKMREEAFIAERDAHGSFAKDFLKRRFGIR